jgi:hypothetical protein
VVPKQKSITTEGAEGNRRVPFCISIIGRIECLEGRPLIMKRSRFMQEQIIGVPKEH